MNQLSQAAPFDLCERSFQFALQVIRLCRILDRRPGVARTLANQLLRSSTSIGANIEEAQAGHSRADFAAKNSIALKEARETRYWLRLISASNIHPQDELGNLINEANELARILATIVKKARPNKPL